jgi:predicted acyl esterase
MRADDGALLAGRLWFPEEGPGPWPVLLMRQPYGRAIASTVTYAHPSWYADRGFVVVVQDVRGCGDSEGQFRGFGQEAVDGAAAVRWARRLPLGNGLVGSYGFSYQGLSQLLIAAADEPAPAGLDDPLPDCLAPAMAGLDERLHWASTGGAHWWSLGLAWALQLAAAACRRRGDRAGWWDIRRSLESGRFLVVGPALLARHDPGGMGGRWLGLDPARPGDWRIHPVAPALLRRPLLLIGGWHDPHLGGVLDLWQRAHQVGGNPELLIGAWTHLQWRGGCDERQLAFFRRHLLGAEVRATQLPATPLPATPAPPSPAQPTSAPPTGGASAGGSPDQPAPVSTDPVLLQDLRSGIWHPWSPPSPPVSLGWRLQSRGLAAVRSLEGRLVAAAGQAGELPSPPGEGVVVLVHDPWRPVPGRGGHLGLDAGLVERGDIDGRADVACFSSEPLATCLDLLGRPWLALGVAADRPGFDLCGALAVVSADGTRVSQISTGFLRLRGESCRQKQELRLELQPLAATLAPGERLRLSLAGAAWPQIAVNPGDGQLPRSAPGPGHRVITLHLHLAGAWLGLDPLLAHGAGPNGARPDGAGAH